VNTHLLESLSKGKAGRTCAKEIVSSQHEAAASDDGYLRQ